MHKQANYLSNLQQTFKMLSKKLMIFDLEILVSGNLKK